MEVHTHSHTERKKFTHYLWEFLMLFLAVFAGFLAENQREHYVEHQREKEYMITILEDLNADLPLIDSTIDDWSEINKSIDSVTDAISFPPKTADMPKVYRHMNEALNIYSFKYNDRTITQLKNSGGFRLIRNKKVANSIIAYDQFNNDAIVNITRINIQFCLNAEALRSKVFSEKVISEINKLYGNNVAPSSLDPWVDSLIKKNPAPLTPENEAIQLFEFKNSLLAQKRDYEKNVLWGVQPNPSKNQDIDKTYSRRISLEII